MSEMAVTTETRTISSRDRRRAKCGTTEKKTGQVIYLTKQHAYIFFSYTSFTPELSVLIEHNFNLNSIRYVYRKKIEDRKRENVTVTSLHYDQI